MSRLIDADALLEFANNQKSKSASMNDIARFHTIDMVNHARWIPVIERLPDSEEDVLVCAIDVNDEDRTVHISSYSVALFGGRKLGYKRWCEPYEYFSHHHKITHWMPLPEPPKER